MLNSSPAFSSFAPEGLTGRKVIAPKTKRAHSSGEAGDVESLKTRPGAPMKNGASRTKALTESIGVLLIDAHAVVRAGLRLLFEDTPGLHLAGEAANGAEAMCALKKMRPAIILLEHGGCESGLEILSPLQEAAPNARVIILSGCDDTKIHRRAIMLGARGLVTKNQGVDVLLKAIRRVAAGELWIERELMHQAMGEIMRPQNADPEAVKIGALTAREREIVTEIGRGLKNKQIAERLFLSETTVRHHLTSIFAKLEVGDRLELVIYAYRHNLCSICRES